jgi:hypothetical protein
MVEDVFKKAAKFAVYFICAVILITFTLGVGLGWISRV